jgi:hypothetical protein
MSDQKQTGTVVILDLEEVFLSQEFGRRPAHSIWGAPAAVESQPAHLEQVFLSEVFGHPEVVTTATQAVPAAAPTASARPTLVLLRGGKAGSSAQDATRARAIAAVSGVAAAALAVTGLASTTGQGSGRPPVAEQAQGIAGPGNGSESGVAGPTVSRSPSSIGTSGGGGTGATLTSFSPPAAAVVPRGANDGVAAATTPQPSSGGQTPGLPSGSGGGGGGGSMLTPDLTAVGNEVSSVGSSVTAASSSLAQALPVASVVPALGTVTTSAANNVGTGSPPNILGAI